MAHVWLSVFTGTIKRGNSVWKKKLKSIKLYKTPLFLSNLLYVNYGDKKSMIDYSARVIAR